MAKVLLTMDEWHVKALDRLARRNMTTKSELIRRLIMKLSRGEIQV